MRLIDANELKKQLSEADVEGVFERKKNYMFNLIDRQPTAFDLDSVFKRTKDGIECAELLMELNEDYEDCNLKNRNRLIFSEMKRCYEEFLQIANSSIKKEEENLERLEVVE